MVPSDRPRLGHRRRLGVRHSHEAFRDALLAGATGDRARSRASRRHDCRSTLAARVSGFDPSEWVSPMKLRRLDRTGATRSSPSARDRGRARRGRPATATIAPASCWAPAAPADSRPTSTSSAFFRGGPTGAPALLFDSTVGNSAASLAGLEFKLRGPNVTISHKEASGLAARRHGRRPAAQGRADAVAAGGVDVVFEMFFKAHDRFGVHVTATAAGAVTAPVRRCRRGFVLGEGGFGLWLERGDRWRAAGCPGSRRDPRRRCGERRRAAQRLAGPAGRRSCAR